MLTLTPRQLRSVQLLFKAIEQFDELVKRFSNPTELGPVYLQIKYSQTNPDIQLDRDIMVQALRQQLVTYHDALGELGVTYVKEKPLSDTEDEETT